uniref:SET domain-containing protein n=1 Tax=Chromera velia CCMP2878 TaxID=1169474 RepID=A0A0G4HQS6_9ALVE|eukprot:Cvel_30466.t1-p1 / transcript=Cvel_30466.t1 / gene=Cvel_30466 / organism=Chromera_velia_CCMP2878 / gene_product=Histone-lysine N-methyltransferase ASHR1, putative / transcript_product=Histone-lysine N-methyltransferase ASHR1, putative / location=Cvel_scaffold4346:1556-4944(+) / protein_length=913 / sequence_SO=supercontig / SO=protein_coding / is_pseudo=false
MLLAKACLRDKPQSESLCFLWLWHVSSSMDPAQLLGLLGSKGGTMEGFMQGMSQGLAHGFEQNLLMRGLFAEQEQQQRTAIDRHNWFPSADEVLQDHLKSSEIPPADVPTESIVTGTAGASMFRRTLPFHLLQRVSLGSLRPTNGPRNSVFIEGVLAADAFRRFKQGGSISCVVGDAEGTVCRLSLYNFPIESEMKTRETYYKGRRILIRNVWFKRFRDGWPGLRVDDPSDVVWDLSVESLCSRERESLTDSHALASSLEQAETKREKGSKLFVAGSHAKAREEYSEGLKLLLVGDVPIHMNEHGLPPPSSFLPPSNSSSSLSSAHTETETYLKFPTSEEARSLVVKLLNNRSAASLRLNMNRLALADARAAVFLQQHEPKAFFRLAQAYLAMGAAGRALEALDGGGEALSFTGGDAGVQAVRKEAESRVRAKGPSDAALAGLVSQATRQRGFRGDGKTPYVGPVFVKGSGAAGGGRGMFAYESISRGSIILVEQAAVAACPAEEEHPFGLGREAALQNDVSLQLKVSRLLREKGSASSEELRSVLASLHPQPDETMEVPLMRDVLMSGGLVPSMIERGKLAEVDAHHIERVVQRNQHGLCLTRLGTHCVGEPGGAGLFPLTSVLNHSCHPNCCWWACGAVIVLVACRNVAAGDELTVLYTNFEEDPSRYYRRKSLQDSHNFFCRCNLCESPPHSPLFLLDQLQLALVCPKGAVCARHRLLPVRLDVESPDFVCELKGCGEKMSAAEAKVRKRKTHDAFEAMRPLFRQQKWREGARAVEAAERVGREVLCPSHHLWGLFFSAATAILERLHNTGDVIRLTIEALEYCRSKEVGMGTVDQVAVPLAIRCAMAVGMHTKTAKEALRCAVEIHSRVKGGGLELLLCSVPGLIVELHQPIRTALKDANKNTGKKENV